jgi:hypothetical protein
MIKRIIFSASFILITGFALAQINLFPEIKEANEGHIEFSYHHDVWGSMEATAKGGGLEFGYNFGKRFHEKMNLNLYCGGMLTGNSAISDEFLINFNRYHEYRPLSETSKKMYTFRREGYGSKGLSLAANFGMLVKPPVNYFPALAFYWKISSTSIKTSAASVLVTYGGESSSDPKLVKSGYGLEIRFPFKKIFYIGGYYEWYRYDKMRLTLGEKEPLKDVISDEFYTHMGQRATIVGFKLGVNALSRY